MGWLGRSSRVLLSAEDRERIEARTPQFVRIPPNSNTPEPFPNLRPLRLSYDKTSIGYQYGFATMPGTDHLYFLHENGLAYFSASTVTRMVGHCGRTAPIFGKLKERVYGATPHGRSILFSQKEGGLKLLSATC